MRKMAMVVVLLMICGPVFAAKKQPAQSKESTAPAAAQKKAVPATADIASKKKAELNGTEWNITLTPMGMGGKGKQETDVITFANDKVGSKNLEGRGYVPSGFSVRLQEDGTVIWETMQVSEKDGTVFWRGDIKDGVMRGVLSRRDKKEKTYDYSFVSAAK